MAAHALMASDCRLNAAEHNLQNIDWSEADEMHYHWINDEPEGDDDDDDA